MNFNTNFDAHWISPVQIVYEVPFTHIRLIIDQPERFSLTKDEILKIYEDHNEPIGFEGKARDKIMKDLILKGWIRIRKNNNFWTVQLNDWNESNQNIIKNFEF